MKNCRLCKNELILDKKLTKNLKQKENIYFCEKCKTYFIDPEPFSYDDSDSSLINY